MELPFPYSIDRSLLPQKLRDVVMEFSPDAELEDFISDCPANPHSFWQFFFAGLLSPFLPAYEIHGLLKMYPMHLLSREQWKLLVPDRLQDGKLLDIGAGQGFVTEKARELFSSITTTETSRSMTKRLRAENFRSVRKDIALHPELFLKKEFDVISILNVLDRCERPKTLLKNCLEFLKDDGVLIITDPLPLEAHLRNNSIFSKPEETLTTNTNKVWEACLAGFYEHTLQPLGLEPLRISRLPYLYKNTTRHPYVALDDFLIVCRKSSCL